MPADKYVKLVLTVIALCLVYLCVVLTRWPAVAAQSTQSIDTSPQPVVVVGWGTMDAKGKTSVSMSRNGTVSDPNIPVRVVGLPIDPVTVRLEYTDTYPLPVGLTSIKRTGEWEPIRSAVEGEPVRPKPGR
jgi:hypothetical protein